MNLKHGKLRLGDLRKKDTKFFIYVLGDPRDGSIFYVGRTKQIAQRYYAHTGAPSQWLTVTRALGERLFEIRRGGFEPVMIVLERTNNPDREQHHIQEFEKTHALVNVRGKRYAR